MGSDCEIAGCETDALVILPLHNKEDGSLITLACLECARKSGVYCLVHKTPHQGFDDGSTACLECIEKDVKLQIDSAIEFANTILKSLPEDERDELLEWAKSKLRVVGISIQMYLFRVLITKAHRLKMFVPKVLDGIKKGEIQIFS